MFINISLAMPQLADREKKKVKLSVQTNSWDILSQQLGLAVVKLIVFKHSSRSGVSVLTSLLGKTTSSEIVRGLYSP